MNVMALMAAVSGVAVLLLTVFFGRQQASLWRWPLFLAAGIVLATGMAGMVPVMFGDTSPQTAVLALEYLSWCALPVGLALPALLCRRPNARDDLH